MGVYQRPSGGITTHQCHEGHVAGMPFVGGPTLARGLSPHLRIERRQTGLTFRLGMDFSEQDALGQRQRERVDLRAADDGADERRVAGTVDESDLNLGNVRQRRGEVWRCGRHERAEAKVKSDTARF